MTTRPAAPTAPPRGARRWAEAAAAVAQRPRLWPVSLRQAFRLAPKGWWRRWPPVPLPDRGYVRFRMLTAYGDPTSAPSGQDVVSWLEWCRQPTTGGR